jgi:hypothetical protein
MERLTIEGHLSTTDFEVLRRSIAAQPAPELELGRDRLEARSLTEGDLNLIAALASVIDALIGLWALRLASRDKSAWNKERAEQLVGEELMRRGVVQFKIEEVENYDGLFGEGTGPCVFTIHDTAKDMRYWVLVLRSGNTATIRLR